MPNPSFRINDSLYNRMKEAAESQNMTLSDIVRESVAHWLDNNGNLSHEIAQETVELLKQQLQTKDEHISQLHQLVAMSQKHSDDLLEDLRKPRSWWHFWQKNGK